MATKLNPLFTFIKEPYEFPVSLPTVAGYFFYYEDDVLKRAPMSDIYDRVAYPETPLQPFSLTNADNGNAVSFSAFNNQPAAESGYLKIIKGNFPATGTLELFIAKNRTGSASPYTFQVGEKFTVAVTEVGINVFDVSAQKIYIKKGEFLGVSKNSTSKPYFGNDAAFGSWYQTTWDITTGDNFLAFLEGSRNLSMGFSVSYSSAAKPTVTKITAVQNAGNYNSIRDLVDSITDASENNQYEIMVPKGTWNEIDWQGKKDVKIIGESRDETIIYLDPLGSMATEVVPADYPFVGEIGKPLNTVAKNFLHIVFTTKDIYCENLTFFAKDSKYPVHIDYQGDYDANFKNCRIKDENCNLPIGMGLWANQNVLFDQCIIEPLVPFRGFFYHNWNNQGAPNSVTFNRCKFVNCDYALINELGSNQDDWVNLHNCFTTKAGGGLIGFGVDKNADGKTFWINPATSLNEPNPVNVPYSIKIDTTGTAVNAFISADSGSFNAAWTGTPQRDINTIKSISITGTQGAVIQAANSAEALSLSAANPNNIYFWV